MGSPQQFILGFKMKWTLCLLCVASVATALPTRDKKAFSLFSVVTFPNAECTTDTTPAMTGICVTAEECSNDGDVIAQAQGNCASGFGVCCMKRVEGSPNAAITSGLTYVQSAGFPQAVAALNPTAAGAAVAAVQRDFNIMGGPNVCQIRFDFITASVTGPGAATGTCATDSISVNTPTRTALQTGVAALCGVLTGQHLIVEVAPGTNAMAATLNIDTVLWQETECGKYWSNVWSATVPTELQWVATSFSLMHLAEFHHSMVHKLSQMVLTRCLPIWNIPFALDKLQECVVSD